MRPARIHPGRPDTSARTQARRGTILIVTIWILMILAAMVLVLSRAMRVEGGSSANAVAELQADAVEQGAIQYILSHLDNQDGHVPTSDEMPCQAIRVGNGLFWILRPNFEDSQSWAYGLVDEASKLNLNTASADALSRLPDMTQEIAASIVDWRDSNTTVSAGGAESEYYLLLDDPYRCKDAPLETVEELLLVKDVTKDILYGEDLNRNGILDANEDDGDLSEPADNKDGQLDHGLAPYVTVYSAEPAASASGSQKINVNDMASRPALIALINSNFPGRGAVVQRNIRRIPSFPNLLDFYYRSGLTASEFTAIAGQLTASSGTGSPKGLINVNTAPQAVLACLPGLDSNDAAALVTARTATGINLDNLGWVAQTLSASKAAAIGGLITTRSYQFSADIVSIAGSARAFRRCRVVVDASTSPPKVVYRQNITHLGWPLDEQIQAKLRAGESLDDVILWNMTNTSNTTSLR